VDLDLYMITLAVNQDRLVSNLRFSFTNREVLIAELMQNARRAGASNVNIEFDEHSKTLTVTDNGSGISNFQSLFTLAESGWDDSIQESEHPFGMGFFSTLFSAEEVEVYSFDQVIRFKTKDALAFSSIAVNTIESYELPLNGSKICLIGIDLTSHEVQMAVKKYAKGFPIQVVLNGVPAANPDAISESFLDSSIGKVRLFPSNSIECYLQGIPVLSTIYCWSDCQKTANVVHLNSDFKGKMPDRSSLFDERVASDRIKNLIRDLWAEKLAVLKLQLSAKDFAEEYWSLARDWGLLDVFNDVPYLPSYLLSVLTDTPVITNWSAERNSFMVRRGSGVSLKEVLSGAAVLFHTLPDCSDDTHWAAAVMALELKWSFVDPSKLPIGHWAYDHLVDLSTMEVKVDFEPLVDCYLNGSQVRTDVTLCNNYSIKSKDHEVIISNQSVFLSNRTLLIPRHSTGDDNSLKQIDCYFYDDTFDEASYDEDVGLLTRLVRAERTKLNGGSQVDTFNDVLNSGNLNAFSALGNSIFVVKLDSTLQRQTIQIAPEHLDRFNQFLDSLTVVS
jgi:hypothetical protein